MNPFLSIIVAVAENGVIGHDNRLLWRLKTDLRRFRSLTLGKPVIMGRKTQESIGRALPGRESIIVTRDRNFTWEGVHIVHSIPEAIALGHQIATRLGVNEIMIAGGAEIYAQTLSQVKRLYITEVELQPHGDALFPEIDRSFFREEKRVAHPQSHDDEAAFVFIDYIRRD